MQKHQQERQDDTRNEENEMFSCRFDKKKVIHPSLGAKGFLPFHSNRISLKFAPVGFSSFSFA